MKIAVVDESCMQTHVTAAEQDSEHTLEITEAEWTEFNDVEEHYEQLLAGFKQRQLAERQLTLGEIGQLRARLSQLETRLGVAAAPAPVAPKAPKQPNPVDETDYGMGVGGRERPQDPTDFRNELADLRDRTTEKRARRGIG
jgi:hypothetical protein